MATKNGKCARKIHEKRTKSIAENSQNEKLENSQNAKLENLTIFPEKSCFCFLAEGKKMKNHEIELLFIPGGDQRIVNNHEKSKKSRDPRGLYKDRILPKSSLDFSVPRIYIFL